MKKKTDLTAYNKQRDFKKTPEPKGAKKKSSGWRFVIQKHKARSLHYDLRLEINGVLVSWAIPKGPSTDPRVKRLAIQTEDHPVSYAKFEGVIPAGQYGAGPVMVWDIGTYKNINEENGKPITMAHAYKRGLIDFFVKGKKIYGGYALVKTKKDWLLIKKRDEYADARRNPTSTENKSVLTDRTMTQIARDKSK